MNSKVLIGIVVLVFLGVGGTFFIANRATDDDSTSNLAQNETSQTSDQQEAESFDPASGLFPQFNPFSAPFVATIEAKDSTEPANAGTVRMVYNNQNLWSVEVSSSEGDLTTIYTGDASFLSNPDGSWTKFPVIPGANDLDIGSYAFTNDDISEIGQNARKIGTESCSLGTCQVWEAFDEGGNSAGKIWFGNDGRIAKMMILEGSTSTDVVFDYSANTNIEVPTEFDEFTIPDFDDFDPDSFLP